MQNYHILCICPRPMSAQFNYRQSYFEAKPGFLQNKLQPYIPLSAVMTSELNILCGRRPLRHFRRNATAQNASTADNDYARHNLGRLTTSAEELSTKGRRVLSANPATSGAAMGSRKRKYGDVAPPGRRASNYAIHHVTRSLAIRYVAADIVQRLSLARRRKRSKRGRFGDVARRGRCN